MTLLFNGEVFANIAVVLRRGIKHRGALRRGLRGPFCSTPSSDVS